MNALAVAVGAVAGALARWQAGLWLNSRWMGFPLGTLLVNVVGGFLIGMALEWFGRQPNEVMKLLLVTGFLGGLTTFSSFSLDAIAMLERGEIGPALFYVAGSVLVGIAALYGGLLLMRGAL